MSKYIKGHIKNSAIDYNNISKIEINDKFIESPKLFYKTYTDLLQNVNNEVYSTTTNVPPFFEIKQPDIEFIKSKLMPTLQMQYDLEHEMSIAGLKNRDFSVIHIRAGDYCLFNNNNIG